MRSLVKRRSSDAGEPIYSEAVQALLAESAADIPVQDPDPWVKNPGTGERILLVPAADYHLDELVPLSEELHQRGHETVFAVGESPWFRTKRGMTRYPDLKLFWLPDPAELPGDIRLVVTLKDTGSMTDWVTDVRSLGIPVIGKVEGAQDFWDADTPEERRPYSNFDLVLCQGQFDAAALHDQKTAIVGSSRLERLWWAPPVEPPETPLALINLNFVYGVRTVDRRLWLDSAVSACEEVGIPYLISIHPAEKTQPGSNMTRVSASALLPHASVLISRFSTVPFEAMAMGVPFVYHNPHGETVKTFADAHGAFGTSDSTRSLVLRIGSAMNADQSRHIRNGAWWDRHVSIEEGNSSETRTVAAVADWL